MGNGVDEWYNWNFILPDNVESNWGWKQNALIQVNSSDRTFRYTPEYHAVKHFTHFISPDSRMVGYHKPTDTKKTPVIIYQTSEGNFITVAGNFSDKQEKVSVKIGNRYLNMTLSPHSFNTYVEN